MAIFPLLIYAYLYIQITFFTLNVGLRLTRPYFEAPCIYENIPTIRNRSEWTAGNFFIVPITMKSTYVIALSVNNTMVVKLKISLKLMKLCKI